MKIPCIPTAATYYLKASVFTLLLSAAPSLFSADNSQIFASGEQQTALVELYTSQGCSSCPPAERWLGELQHDPRLWKEIVPLAFHVDYWDYIGWKDIYAQPQYATRQRRYATESAVSSVYTPGFVVDGQEWRGWFQRRALPLSGRATGKLHAVLKDNQLRANYTARNSLDRKLTLHVAILGMGLDVDVKRGENAGRQLAQDFIVMQYKSLTAADATWSTTLLSPQTPGANRLAIALWVSEPGSQKPLQATGGWLANSLTAVP